MTLGRPLNQSNLDKARSQTQLQINVNNLQNKLDSSRPASIDDTVQQSAHAPGLNMRDLQLQSFENKPPSQTRPKSGNLQMSKNSDQGHINH